MTKPITAVATGLAVMVPEFTGAVTVPLPPGVAPGNLSAGKVAGDCMTGDHIHDGDLILIDHGREARDGDIAVVLITLDGIRGPMLKRVRYDGPVLRSLEPSNPTHEPIMLTPEHDAVVEGVCVGVVRALG